MEMLKVKFPQGEKVCINLVLAKEAILKEKNISLNKGHFSIVSETGSKFTKLS